LSTHIPNSLRARFLPVGHTGRRVGSTEPESVSEVRRPTSDIGHRTSDIIHLTSDIRHLTSGFTLIDLLVVIIMIAIRAGLLFPAINGAQNQAKKVQAKNDVTQIVSAVNAYYTEYGYYLTSPTTDLTFSANNNTLFDVLRNVTGANPGNTS